LIKNDKYNISKEKCPNLTIDMAITAVTVAIAIAVLQSSLFIVVPSLTVLALDMAMVKMRWRMAMMMGIDVAKVEDVMHRNDHSPHLQKRPHIPAARANIHCTGKPLWAKLHRITH